MMKHHQQRHHNQETASTSKVLVTFMLLVLLAIVFLSSSCALSSTSSPSSSSLVTFAHAQTGASPSRSFSRSQGQGQYAYGASTSGISSSAQANANSMPRFEAGSSHLNIEGIQRGISVESIRAGKHHLVLQLVGGSARFARHLSDADRLALLRKLFNSVPVSSGHSHTDFGSGTWDSFKHQILSADHGASATVSTSGRTMKITFGTASDFELDTPERVLINSGTSSSSSSLSILHNPTTSNGGIPTELFARGSSISAVSNRDFIVFPDGRLDIEVVDTGTPMVSHPVLLDIGLAHNANTSYPLKLMRGRDCRMNSFLMDVDWPTNYHHQQSSSTSTTELPSSSSSSSTYSPLTNTDESTIVEFTPSIGSEQITICYVPQGEEVQTSGESSAFLDEPIYIAANSPHQKPLSISGPLNVGARSIAVGETATVQILGFNLTYDDVAALATSGQCDALDVTTALQLPSYLASSSLAEVQVQVPEVGVYDLCYYREGAAAFVPVSTISVTHTDGKHKTHDVNVSKGVNVDLTGNVYSSNFRVLDGGIVRLNSHQVNTTHFEWRDGVIEGWGGINCQMGVEPHVIAAASNREISVQIQNFGVMFLHVDHLHFTGQGMIHNHRHLTIVAESPKALINTADHFARRIVNGVRGRIDFVIGSSDSVSDVIHPVLISTAVFDNLGQMIVSPHMQVKLRRLVGLPMGSLQLQLGSTVLIENGLMEGSFELDTDAVLGFAGDVVLSGATFATSEKSHILFNAVHYVKLANVQVTGHGHVVLHSQHRRYTGIVALEGTTTFGKNTLLAIKNVSLSSDRNIAYLNVYGRLICHVPSVVLGDNIYLSSYLNSVLFGSGSESARVVPQRVPPNNSAFVLPENASLILVDVDNVDTNSYSTTHQKSSSLHDNERSNVRPSLSSSTVGATTQVCSQYLVVPVHVILSGDVQLLGCVMLPLGGQTSGTIYGSKASEIVDATNKYAFCKTALSGEASGNLGATASKNSQNKNNNDTTTDNQEDNIEKIVKVPGDVCISLGSDSDSEYYSLIAKMMMSDEEKRNSNNKNSNNKNTNNNNKPSSSETRNSNLALGGTHVFKPNGNQNIIDNNPDQLKAMLDIDRLEVLPQAVLEATAVVKLLAKRGIIVRPESAIALSLGGIIGSTILTLEGTLVVDSQFPLLINGTVQAESTAALVVRAYDTFAPNAKSSSSNKDNNNKDKNNQKHLSSSSSSSSSSNSKELTHYTGSTTGSCSYPLQINGGCSFLDSSRITIDGRPPVDESTSIALVRAELGIIGTPLIRWMDDAYSNETLAVAIRRARTLSTTGKPTVDLPTPFRKKIAVCFVIIVAAIASLHFYARIGQKFIDELFAEPDYPMWLGIAEFWNSVLDWFAVFAVLLEVFFLCAPAFHEIIYLPPQLHTVRLMLSWMVSANHTEGGWEGPYKYVILFCLDFFFIVMWLYMYISRANPETQRSASPMKQKLFGFAQQASTVMTFLGLTFFIPITATLMEPISCKFLFRGAFDCHHSEEYLYPGTISLLCFLILAPLSGTSLRTPFSHPPFMRDLDIRYKRTYIHLQCVLLGAMISCWKIFSRNAFQLQLAQLFILTLMFLLYRYSHPCIYENVNTMRQALFVIPFFASLAALIQLVRYDGVPSSLACDQAVEYGFVIVFVLGFIVAIGLIILTIMRGSQSEGMPSFNPAATAARNAVLYRFSEVERIQLKMYNASTSAERARLAEDLADKRVEYQQALQFLRKKLAPLQMRFYLGDDAVGLVDSGEGNSNGIELSNRETTGMIPRSHRDGDGNDSGNNNNNNRTSTTENYINIMNRVYNNGMMNDDDDQELLPMNSNNNQRNNDDDDPADISMPTKKKNVDMINNNNNENNNNNNNNNAATSSADGGGVPASAIATPDELRELTPEQMSNYTEGPILGRGTYGTVYMAMLSIGKLVAVKVVPIIKKQKTESLTSIKREVDVLRNMSHPNVIRCYGCSYPPRKDSICIFMELATSGSLTQIVRRFGGLSERVVQVYTKQILQGLQYLHNRGVIHRDIKGENILIDGQGSAKLGDFGCSKFLADVANKSQQGCASLVGSPFWMAPEVIRNETYGTKSDVWSTGCTVVECLNGGYPAWSETFDNVYSAMYYIGNTTSLPSNIPENVSDLCKDFLSKCFERDVSKRASVSDLLKHPWLSDENMGSPLTADQLHTAINHSGGSNFNISSGYNSTHGGHSTPSTTTRLDGNHNNNSNDNNSGGATFSQENSGDNNNDYDDNNDGENNGMNHNTHHSQNGGRSFQQNGNNNANTNNNNMMPGRGWSGLFDGVHSGNASTHMTGDSTFNPSTLQSDGDRSNISHNPGSTF